ncbi:MAG: hypothetical protein LBN30_08900 [Oscillospiraceae bacterium]|jgi:hypothetical protein|nr:hypothetical protein [Oscillospiraceae bacterium]
MCGRFYIDSMARRRCLIPESGYFEWQKLGSRKIWKFQLYRLLQKSGKTPRLTRFTAILLAILMLVGTMLTACSSPKFDSYVSASITQGETVKLLLNAADFYSPNLDESVILSGVKDAGTFNDVEYTNNEIISDIINELLNTEQIYGSKEQKIADFYKSAADMATRDKLGYAPIKPYIDAIDAAEDYYALWAVNEMLTTDLGIGGLMGVELYTSLNDSSQYDLYIGGMYPYKSKDLYASSPEFEAKLKQVAIDILFSTGTELAERKKRLMFLLRWTKN